MDQGPPHKTRHTETIRKETWEDPGGLGHRGKVPEQNTNSLRTKIKNRQMGPHKITVSAKQRTLSEGQNRNQQSGKRSSPTPHLTEG